MTKYQTSDVLYCVTATYDLNQEIAPLSVPLFNGKVIGVYNYENNGTPSKQIILFSFARQSFELRFLCTQMEQ